MEDSPIKKYKKTYTGVDFNLKYKNLVKVTFENGADLSNTLYSEGEFEVAGGNTTFFKFENLDNMGIRSYKKNEFIKWILDVEIPEDAKVTVRSHKYENYTIKYFATTKIKLTNKREFWKEYQLIKTLVIKDKYKFFSYIKYCLDPEPNVLKIILGFQGLFLQYLNPQYQTQELAEIAVKSRGDAIQYVKSSFITQELCNIAVRRSSLALKFIPYRFQNLDMCVRAVKIIKRAIEYADPKYLEELNKITDIVEKPNKYLYTPALHIKSMLSDGPVDNLDKITKDQVPDKVIQYVKSHLDLEIIPTIKDIRRILVRTEHWVYRNYMPEIIHKLGYHVPIISQEQKEQIAKYFEDNKEKFIISRNPLKYYDLNAVTNYIIEKLDLDVELRFLVDA
jgi:hypothetical protein